jgi:hypothetical protein
VLLRPSAFRGVWPTSKATQCPRASGRVFHPLVCVVPACVSILQDFIYLLLLLRQTCVRPDILPTVERFTHFLPVSSYTASVSWRRSGIPPSDCRGFVSKINLTKSRHPTTMSSIFDSMIPSRRREQKRLREEAKRLNERWGDAQISAPNDGCWIGNDHTPELGWASPSTQGFASPDVANTLVNNSPEIGDYGEQVIIVDTDTDPAAHVYHEELEKNAVTFTIPLPWPSRRAHSRSPSVSQSTPPSSEAHRQASPRPSTSSAVVYKPTSDQYMKELGDLSRGNSPVQSIQSSVHGTNSLQNLDLPSRQTPALSSLVRRSPSPPVDREEGHKISAIMLLSPVVEDFPSRPMASSTFSRASSQRNIAHFTRQIPSPPPERPSTAMSATSTVGRSEVGTAISVATAVTDTSFHTAITHHTSRSSSRGPGLAHTSTMRSSSREPATRRAMSREPYERRAMSREPVNRRAMSREPVRRRAMTGESVIRRPSFEELQHRASSRSGRTSIESDSSDDGSTSEVGRQASNSAVGGGYYASMADEYRNIAWESAKAVSSDSESLVGRVSKLVKDKSRPREKEYAPAVPSKELVPSGQDLYS